MLHTLDLAHFAPNHLTRCLQWKHLRDIYMLMADHNSMLSSHIQEADAPPPPFQQIRLPLVARLFIVTSSLSLPLPCAHHTPLPLPNHPLILIWKETSISFPSLLGFKLGPVLRRNRLQNLMINANYQISIRMSWHNKLYGKPQVTLNESTKWWKRKLLDTERSNYSSISSGSGRRFKREKLSVVSC